MTIGLDPFRALRRAPAAGDPQRCSPDVPRGADSNDTALIDRHHLRHGLVCSARAKRGASQILGHLRGYQDLQDTAQQAPAAGNPSCDGAGIVRLLSLPGGSFMDSFDVRVFAIRRRPGRTAFEVRWWVAGRDKSRSFVTRAPADSYRAELIRAARRGLEFDPVTGEPAAWAVPEPVTVTWYQHAVAYAQMKWPHLAPHSRASLADALATVTPLLTRETRRRPSAGMLRAAFTDMPSTRSGAPAPRTRPPPARWLGWNGPPYQSASSATLGSSGLPWMACAPAGRLACGSQHDHPQASRIPPAPSATPSSSGCCPPTQSKWCSGTRPGPPSPAQRRSGRSGPG